MNSAIWTTISSIIKLIILVCEVYYYKSKLKIEAKIKYEKEVEKYLKICEAAMKNIKDQAKEEFQQMDIEDLIDDEINDEEKA